MASRWSVCSGVLPEPVRRLARRTLGLSQIVLSGGAARASLDRGELTVPYGARSALLGLDAFPLAVDGPEHTAARDLVDVALRGSDRAHERAIEDVATWARATIDGASGRFDVLGDLVVPALTRWVEGWFGLPGQGPRLLRTSRMITHAMFLNPKLPTGTVDVLGLERATQWVVGHRLAITSLVTKAPPGTLAAQVLQGTEGDADLAARFVLGLTVGPLALGSQSLANVVDRLLDRPDVLATMMAAREPRAEARPVFLEALRHAPPLPGVLRTSPGITVRPRPGPPFTLPRGQVLMATQVALACPNASVAVDQHLAFGSGGHRCLGADQITDVAGVVLPAVARRTPTRVEGPRGQLTKDPGPSDVRDWDFPGSLEVVFTT
jgi:cytochrome P450